MAVIVVSVQDGLASDVNSWSPSKPAVGDTVTVSHLIDIDEDTIYGTSPNSAEPTRALSVEPGGRITISEDITLTLRGGYATNDAQTIMEAGSTLSMDPTNASNPADAFYPIDIGTGSQSLANNILIANGTSSKRCTIETLGSGTDSRSAFRALDSRSCQLDATFLDVKRMNDPAVEDSAFRPQAFNAGFIFRWLTGTMDDCGKIEFVGNGNPAAILQLENVTFTNPVNPFLTVLDYRFFAPLTTGKRILKQCAIEGECVFGDCIDLNAEECTFNGRYTAVAQNSYQSTFKDCLIVQKIGSVESVIQNVDNCFLAIQDAVTVNPHGFQTQVTDDAVTIKDCIIQVISSVAVMDGDMVLSVDTPSAQTNQLLNTIVLRNAAGVSSGTLLTLFGTVQNAKWNIKNCMAFNGNNATKPAIAVAETGNGFADTLEVRDSIFFAADLSGFKVFSLAASETQDIGLAANLDFNCGFNQDAGQSGKGYDIDLSGTPGVNDVDVDPGFVDIDRDAAAFDLSLGGPGTFANLLGEFMKRNTAAYNPAYNLPSMMEFIRGGLQASNQLLKGTASDGGDIGPVPVVVQQPPSETLVSRLLVGEHFMIS